MKITRFSRFLQAVSVVLLVLVCLAAIPNAQAQASGITSILDLQYPDQAVLQSGVAQVTVTFKVYYNLYYNPGGYLVFGIYDTLSSNYVKGSAATMPNICQTVTGAQYANVALCAITPFTPSGSESALFTLTFNAAKGYDLSVVTFIWDTRNLQSGNLIRGSDNKVDFAISVTGQALTTATTSSSIATTSVTPGTIPPTTSTTLSSSSSVTSTLDVQPQSDYTALLPVIIIVALFAAVIVFVVFRHQNARSISGSRGVEQRRPTPKPSASFCMNCGTRLPEGDRFCSECGGKQ